MKKLSLILALLLAGCLEKREPILVYCVNPASKELIEGELDVELNRIRFTDRNGIIRFIDHDNSAQWVCIKKEVVDAKPNPKAVS